jgi:hypothetical protein
MNLAGINHPAFILFKAVHDDDLPRVQATLADDPNLWARARLVYRIEFLEPRATPLIVAIRRRRLAIAHWLIDHRGSADIDEMDCDGCTALHVACEFGLAGIVRALIGAGANPLLDSCAGIPLSCAADYDHIEAMEMLLELPHMRKNMNHVNDTLRKYSLRGSALKCSNEVVECLVNAGANAFCIDDGLFPRLRPSTVTMIKRRLEEATVWRLLYRARRVADVMYIVKMAPARAPEWLLRRRELTPVIEIVQGGTCLTDTLAFLLGVGATNACLPQELFLEVMDMLIPSGDKEHTGRHLIEPELSWEEEGIFAGDPGDIYCIDTLNFMGVDGKEDDD